MISNLEKGSISKCNMQTSIAIRMRRNFLALKLYKLLKSGEEASSNSESFRDGRGSGMRNASQVITDAREMEALGALQFIREPTASYT